MNASGPRLDEGGCEARTGERCELEGAMRDMETHEQSSNHQVLFPVAVGAVFLVVLVVGALLG